MIHEKYIDLLPTTQLRRDILKIINGYPDAKLKMENIKDYLIKYGYDDLKDNTLYTNLEYLEKERIYCWNILSFNGQSNKTTKFLQNN